MHLRILYSAKNLRHRINATGALRHLTLAPSRHILQSSAICLPSRHREVRVRASGTVTVNMVQVPSTACVDPDPQSF